MPTKNVPPKIPPNCPHIVIDDGSENLNQFAMDTARKGIAYFKFPDDGSRIYLDEGDAFSAASLKHWRPIIVCIAAEYWLIEGLAKTCGPKKEEMVSRGLGLPEREACYDNYEYECESKADEWREWGRKT